MAVIFVLIKIGLVSYYGYSKIDGNYSGPYFFNWRLKVDHTMSKSVYTPFNKKNAQSEKGDDGSFFQKYWKEIDNSLSVGNTENGEYPMYMDGLQDTFVFGPTKTWYIFKDNELAYKLEKQYLNFRKKYIMTLYPEIITKINEKKASHDKEEEKKKNEDSKYKIKKFSPNTPIKLNFKVIEKEELKNFFETSGNDFNGIYNDFKTIINKLLSGKVENYKVNFSENSASMSPPLSEDVMKLVNKAFPEFGLEVDDVNKWFFRIGIINMTPLDAHILHRIYFYYLYIVSFVDVKNAKGKEKYDEYDKKYSELSKKADGAEGEDKKVILLKMKNTNAKRASARINIIFNQLSGMIANILGNKGAILDSKDDQRNFFVKLGCPKTAPKKSVVLPLEGVLKTID